MEIVCGPIFMRFPDTPLKKGQVVEGHQHEFDHVTRVIKGKFKIEKWKPRVNEDGTEMLDERGERILVKEMEVDVDNGAFGFVNIEAYAWHRLTALEDNSIYVCEFTHRDPHGNVIQRYDGWRQATL